MTKNPIQLTKQGIRFLTYDVWKMTLDNASSTMRYLISVIKALFLSIRFFVSDRMMEKASALTYYTLLAIVPLFALILGIAKGFNIQDVIQESLASSGNDDTLSYIFRFANSYLEHSKTGVIMGIGIVLLLWVIYSLIGNIESVFNQIWQVKKGRSTIRKISDYLSITLIIPLLIFLVCGLQIASHAILSSNRLDVVLSFGLEVAFNWLPYVLIIIVFTLTYMVIPNAKVKFRNALIAGAVAGTGFIAFQNLYINGQIWVSKYSAIYGSFAALPLLLLWLQMSWVICLYGSELSFAIQNMRNFDFEKDTQNISRQYYKFLCCTVSGLIYSQFPNQKLTTEDISTLLHIPSKLCGNIISHLLDLEIIADPVDHKSRDEERYWIPCKRTESFTVADLLETIENNGSTDFNFDHTSRFAKQWNIMDEMRQAASSVGQRQLLRDFDYSTLFQHESSTHSTSQDI